MKPLFRSIAVLTLSAASLSAFASSKPSDLFGEPAVAPSPERAIVIAVADRTITIDDKTKWVNVEHFEVIRFVSKGREFTWYFDGMAQPRPFDLTQVAPAGFVDHSVTVYVSPSGRDLVGGG
jgi:hypothetical protein